MVIDDVLVKEVQYVHRPGHCCFLEYTVLPVYYLTIPDVAEGAERFTLLLPLTLEYQKMS